MGAHIKALDRVDNVPEEIIICLRNLKDLHRNPLMHLGQSLEDVDDALALINAIHTAITAMMKEMAKQHDS